jgi:hypothetical protein
MLGPRVGPDTRDMSQVEPKTCALRSAAEARVEICPEERCAFWEPGGAVLGGNCLVERLGVDVSNADLARYLLEVRERLERAKGLADAERAHSEFARRLGRDV